MQGTLACSSLAFLCVLCAFALRCCLASFHRAQLDDAVLPVLALCDPELDPRAAVQHARLVDLTDQLLVRTGEMAHRQEEGPNRKIFGAMARYLPALSGMRLL